MQYKSNLLHKFITSRQGYPRHMYFGDVMLSVLQNQKLTKFIKSVLLLTGTAIIMRAVSVYFNVYLTGKLGEEGIGLFTLVTSVYSFAITFATSAVNLASTRLVSEALGTNSHMAVRSYMRKCICYSMAFGFGASFLLFSLAPAIGIKLLGDQRTVTSLRFFALTLPCIALSSCLNGYFTAVRRVAKNAAVQFCEQSVRIGVCVFLLTFFMPSDLELACVCVVCGGCSADLLSFIYCFIMYKADMKKHISKAGKDIEKGDSRLLSIALPMALSSYVRSGLVTIEHLLIPWGLRKKGGSNSEALRTYGIIQAMALPIIMFPYALLTPFSNLLIPEVAERNARGDKSGIERVSASAFGFVLVFGIGISGIMSFYSYELGLTVCKSAQAAEYIKMIAPLVPVMYLDTVTDSILKGLDEQLYTMRVNIMDAFLSVIIVFLLVPRIGIYGYIAEIFFCELINASFSVWKLLSVVKFKTKIVMRALVPLVSIVLSTFITRLVFFLFPVGLPLSAFSLTAQVAFTALLYLFLLYCLYRVFSRFFIKKQNSANITEKRLV